MYQPEKLQPGKDFGDWQFVREIGSGGFGLVTLWKSRKTHEEVVIKQCRNKLDDKNRLRWIEEIHLMNSMTHKNLVSGCQVPEDIEKALKGPEPVLGLEYCEGDLRKVLSHSGHCCGLKEKAVLDILQDVSCGLEFLHTQPRRIVHRDLKPENILLSYRGEETVYKITDLGYAKQMDTASICQSFVGTIQYLAPELYDQSYTATADYWSFGTVIFECITGTRPFLQITDSAFKWPQLIKEKSDQHIWGYYDEISKRVQFLTEIPTPNQMCNIYLHVFKDWFQLVLRHNAQKRGHEITENGKSECFARVGRILAMKIIHVLNIFTCSDMAYQYQPNDTGLDLKRFLGKESGIPVENQILLFSNGQDLQDDDRFEQCLQSNVLYLFNTSRRAKPSEKYSIPDRVRELIGNPEEQKHISKLKADWAEASFYCNKIASNYRSLLEGQKALLNSIASSQQKLLQNLQDELNESKIRLETVLRIYSESYTFDLQYCNSAEHRTPEEDECVDEWEQMNSEVLSFKVTLEIDELKKSMKQAQEECSELQKNHLAERSSNQELEDLAQQTEVSYDKLRRKALECKERKQEMKHDSTNICAILLDCLRRKDKLYHAYFENIKKIIINREDLLNNIQKVKEQIKKLKEKEELTIKRQLYRQATLWKLFSLKNPSLHGTNSQVSACNSLQISLHDLIEGQIQQKECPNTQVIVTDFEERFSQLRYLMKNEKTGNKPSALTSSKSLPVLGDSSKHQGTYSPILPRLKFFLPVNIDDALTTGNTLATDAITSDSEKTVSNLNLIIPPYRDINGIVMNPIEPSSPETMPSMSQKVMKPSKNVNRVPPLISKLQDGGKSEINEILPLFPKPSPQIPHLVKASTYDASDTTPRIQDQLARRRTSEPVAPSRRDQGFTISQYTGASDQRMLRTVSRTSPHAEYDIRHRDDYDRIPNCRSLASNHARPLLQTDISQARRGLYHNPLHSPVYPGYDTEQTLVTQDRFQPSFGLENHHPYLYHEQYPYIPPKVRNHTGSGDTMIIQLLTDEPPKPPELRVFPPTHVKKTDNPMHQHPTSQQRMSPLSRFSSSSYIDQHDLDAPRYNNYNCGPVLPIGSRIQVTSQRNHPPISPQNHVTHVDYDIPVRSSFSQNTQTRPPRSSTGKPHIDSKTFDEKVQYDEFMRPVPQNYSPARY